MTPQRILVSGASGFIGTELVRSWVQDRIHVTQLVRNPRRQSASSTAPGPQPETLVWDPGAPQPISGSPALIGVDAAVHLSGASVADARWTERRKREIVSSRVESTQTLVALLKQIHPLPKVFVCASAIGIYGDRGDEVLTESSSPGNGFLAETCVAWENAARAAEEAGIRVVHTRFGVVLSPEGGALAKLLPLFRLGLGGNLGDGRAWMPWVTLRDVIDVLRFAVENEAISGPVNVVAPNPVANAEFTRALGAAVHRPTIFPAPAFALRIALGQMADEALLASARVVPAKLAETGYHFSDPEIGSALQTMLTK